jgi:hypothetical protein
MVGIPHKSRPMGSICMSGHVQENDGFWLLATVKSGQSVRKRASTFSIEAWL